MRCSDGKVPDGAEKCKMPKEPLSDLASIGGFHWLPHGGFPWIVMDSHGNIMQHHATSSLCLRLLDGITEANI